MRTSYMYIDYPKTAYMKAYHMKTAHTKTSLVGVVFCAERHPILGDSVPAHR